MRGGDRRRPEARVVQAQLDRGLRVGEQIPARAGAAPREEPADEVDDALAEVGVVLGDGPVQQPAPTERRNGATRAASPARAGMADAVRAPTTSTCGRKRTFGTAKTSISNASGDDTR